MNTRHIEEGEVETGRLRNISEARGDESSSSEYSSDDEASTNWVRRGGVVLMSVGAIAGCAAVLMLAYAALGDSSKRVEGPTSAAQSVKLADTLPISMPTTTSPFVGTPPFPSVLYASSAPAAAASAVDQALPEVANKRRHPNRPDESMHDGNVCDDTEELYAGLCYTKCDVLTSAAYPHRSTAFSCCATDNCANIFNLKAASLLPCNGFDVSSADNGTACPHFPGVCLEDEEQFMGQCYEKCSMLTNGEYPNRVAAATCCKTEGMACFNPLNDKTAASFLVGGGKSDDDSKTPGRPHGPLKSMAESM